MLIWIFRWQNKIIVKILHWDALRFCSTSIELTFKKCTCNGKCSIGYIGVSISSSNKLHISLWKLFRFILFDVSFMSPFPWWSIHTFENRKKRKPFISIKIFLDLCYDFSNWVQTRNECGSMHKQEFDRKCSCMATFSFRFENSF